MPDRPAVLLVENATASHPSNRPTLDTRGYAVRVADSPEQMLDILAEQPFDLVVMDAELAGPTAALAIRQLRFREEDDGRHTPVLVVTELAGDEHQAAGADACLAKPYRPEDLLDLVDGALSMHEPASVNLPPPMWLEDDPTA